MSFGGSQSQSATTVHSASCIKDGVVTCFCDRPAIRLVSRTQRNPDRVFYSCRSKGVEGKEGCRFFEWEDCLPALGPSQSPQPPQPSQSSQVMSSQSHQSPQRTNALAFPSTPSVPKAFLSQLATPQSTPGTSPVKRSYNHMSTGSRPPKTPSSTLSPEAGAARLANIKMGLNDAGFYEDTMVRAVQTEPEPELERISPTDDYDGLSVRESATPNRPDIDSDTDEADSQPAKRSRTVTKSENARNNLTTTTPRRSSSTLSDQLPTPSSPTAFTRAGRRAYSRASANGTAIASFGSGKQRAPSVASNSSGASEARSLITAIEAAEAAAQRRSEEEWQGSATGQGSHPNGLHNDTVGQKPSVQKQLADIFSSKLNTASSSEPRGRTPLYAAAASAIEKSREDMLELKTIITKMGNRETALLTKTEAQEDAIRSKEERIRELESENASLMEKCARLEEFRSSIEQLHDRLNHEK